MAVED